MNSLDIISLTTAVDVLQALRKWMRTERQRRCWTQAELSRRSGVPASTISRLEQTGLCSTDALFAILFALNRLDALADFVRERQRLVDLPTTLRDESKAKPVLRVRMRKETS